MYRIHPKKTRPTGLPVFRRGGDDVPDQEMTFVPADPESNYWVPRYEINTKVAKMVGVEAALLLGFMIQQRNWELPYDRAKFMANCGFSEEDAKALEAILLEADIADEEDFGFSVAMPSGRFYDRIVREHGTDAAIVLGMFERARERGSPELFTAGNVAKEMKWPTKRAERAIRKLRDANVIDKTQGALA